ncbi:MAG: protein kinase [Gammaproteobacteria bacterium]
MTTRVLRQNVFICYSHADTKYLKHFELKLRPAVGDKLSVWSDQKIAAGADWHSEIERQLHAATAALLLVSDSFLSSSYIRTVELPTILERHAKEGLDVFWVPISWILDKQVALSALQAAWPLDQPLISLSKSKRDEAVKKICERVLSAIGQLTYVSEERVDRLLDDVQRLLPPHSLNAAEPIGDGDFAVVYRGEMDGRAVAVKVLVDYPMRNHLKGFSEFVHDIADLTHPSVASLYQAVLDENPQFLVLEYVQAPCLGRYLRTVDRPFETDHVVSLVQGLALALDEYHRRRVVYGPLTANDVFYDQERNLLRISAVGLSNYLAVNDPISGGFPRGPVAASYMVPEQYTGAIYGPRSDQYSLGLIAFEMLEGKQPVCLACPADLEVKRKFFQNPESFAGEWKSRHPLLASIVFRMLSEDPDERWESLRVVAERLGEIESEAIAVAKASYGRSCQRNQGFYAAFYERLFAKHPAIRVYFRDLDQQYSKLDSSVQFLLNFTDAPRVEPTVLTGTAEQHRRFAITPAQFDDFAQSFLDTLRSVGESEQVVHAWKRSIRPGLEYLKRQASAAPTPLSSREHPPVGTAHPGLSNSRTGKRSSGARRRPERVPVASR